MSSRGSRNLSSQSSLEVVEPNSASVSSTVTSSITNDIAPLPIRRIRHGGQSHPQDPPSEPQSSALVETPQSAFHPTAPMRLLLKPEPVSPTHLADRKCK
ncbi:unnamed protein product [Protopolystoma xenopodis]|uniref:Uncharacterized protein n=1 Tax=Protopolystoma xenopodis TaxID=117903 RepID=A0A448WEF3_9PLAT|nr:unnamed protein product [Protopolystoma xenopodis]